jgi:hypothetical protein
MNSVDFRSYWAVSWWWSYDVCGIAPRAQRGGRVPADGKVVGLHAWVTASPRPLARCGQVDTRSAKQSFPAPLTDI